MQAESSLSITDQHAGCRMVNLLKQTMESFHARNNYYAHYYPKISNLTNATLQSSAPDLRK